MQALKHRLEILRIQPMDDEELEPVPEREIKQIERKIGQPLPDDYRGFLKNYGTSLFGLAVSYPSPSGGASLSFGYFYGSDSSDDGVLENYDFYEGEFPREMTPIAADGMGNMFLLSGAGSSRGSIYYWDHDIPVEADSSASPHYSGLERVAASFTEFVISLRLDP